ncbi:MAG: hypothetical protein EOO51_12725 [Flavobacterium sp.]|nr:MAG: hypothetical protein EOO51_12725 [Flavobacterium sp.]
MNFPISITPADAEMTVLLKAVSLLNSYKLAGFDTPKKFVEIVCEYFGEYGDYDGQQKLKAFWAARVKDEKLNNDLQRVLILIGK